MPLDTEFDCGRVDWRAVVEIDAPAHLHHKALAAVRPLPLGGELRDDVELGADVEELVAQRGKNDAAGEGPGHARVEHVGIVGKSDAQGLRCAGWAGNRQEQAQAYEEGFPARHQSVP